MFITTPQNWDALRQIDIPYWPMRDRYVKGFKPEVDDEVLIYVSKYAAIAGVAQILAKPQGCTPFIFKGDVYSYKIPIRYTILLQTEQMLGLRTMLDELTLIKNKKSWGAAFQRSVIKIPPTDYTLIRQKLSKIDGIQT